MQEKGNPNLDLSILTSRNEKFTVFVEINTKNRFCMHHEFILSWNENVGKNND